MALSKGTYQLVVRNIQLVNVGTLSVEPAWVAVSDGRIAYVGRSGEPIPEAEVIIDGEGDYLVPSLIDAHMHIESSFTTPRRFVEAALPAGTGTILSDPHEIANVAGVEGVDWIVRASEGLPMDIYFALPSCVPATNTELETPGADLRLEQLQELYARHPERFIALGEVMDFTALLDPNSRLHPILDWAKERRLVIDGHCPSLPPEDRQVYFSHGIMADHTITNPEKITSELAMGVWVQLQEKSVTQENVEALQKLPMEQVLLITDDYAPSRFAQGHINTVVRKAIALGLDPLQAIASTTVRAARFLGLRDVGIISPGYWANFWTTESLQELVPKRVFYRGRDVRAWLEELPTMELDPVGGPMHIPAISPEDLTIATEGPLPALVSNGETTTTQLGWVDWQGHPYTDPLPPGYAWCLATTRHSPNKEVALCLLKNYGPQRGAIASTVAHDSHSVIAVGQFPDLLTAISELARLQGGFVAVEQGQVTAKVHLPYAGLLSDEPAAQIAEQVRQFEEEMSRLGVVHERALVFFTVLSLTVSPYYKLTPKGVIDVQKREIIWRHR